jgi:hypothetical protein
MSVRFLVLAAVVASRLAAPVVADDKKDEPVSGKFTGNGKEAKLAFATAFKSDTDKDRIVLLFTEKDPSREKNPRVKAVFGDLGSALIITVTPEGKVVGCEVAHAAHKKGMFNDIGTLTTTDFKIADGKVTGGLTTDGEKETFGEKWEVKLTFAVKKP